ncbi:hypothetical protein PWT90_10591 [Aphanocladium album]|nr:hypothetical protein PWT90_10591 [Aphanocladium album]
MAPPRPQDSNPVTWAEYDGRASPSRSLNTGNLAEENVFDDDDDEEEGGDNGETRRLIHGIDRRRSSVGNRLAAMADLGGVNSFRAFARSWQRAADFAEVIPRRPSFVYNDAAETHAQSRRRPTSAPACCRSTSRARRRF